MTEAGYFKILDHRGAPIPRASANPIYEGASFGRRLNTWGTSSIGPDSALFSSLTTLRARSRQLVRSDPLAAGGMSYGKFMGDY